MQQDRFLSNTDVSLSPQIGDGTSMQGYASVARALRASALVTVATGIFIGCILTYPGTGS